MFGPSDFPLKVSLDLEVRPMIRIEDAGVIFQNLSAGQFPEHRKGKKIPLEDFLGIYCASGDPLIVLYIRKITKPKVIPFYN